MKKLALSIAIILGLGMTAFADGDNNNGGLFRRGAEPNDNATNTRSVSLMLPGSHGQDGDQSSPLGSGVAVLLGLGAAYLVAKRSKEE